MPQAQMEKPLTNAQRAKLYEWIEAGKSNDWIMSRSFMQGRSPVVLSGFRANYTRRVKVAKPIAANRRSVKTSSLTKTQAKQIEELSSNFARSIVKVLNA